MVSRAYMDIGRPEDISGGIKVARVLCIFSVCYVHVWIGVPQGSVAVSGHEFQATLVFLFGDFLGRSSVPLLSIISGWLVASTLKKNSGLPFIAGKAETLLGPMIVWNLLAVSVILPLVAVGAGGRFSSLQGLGPILEEITFWNGTSLINVQNIFLRDMFVAMLAMPLLIRLPSGWLIAISGLCMAAQVERWPLYVLERPAIPAFMILGILVRRGDYQRRIREWAPYAVFATVALAFFKLFMAREIITVTVRAEGIINSAFRLASAMLMWEIATVIAASRFRLVFERLEPYVFLLFCSHTLVFILIGPALGTLFGSFGDPLFPIVYLIQPVIAVMLSVALGTGLQRSLPLAARFLSGGRLARLARSERQGSAGIP